MREEGGRIGKNISDGLDMHGLGWVVAVNIQESTVPTPISWAMVMGKGGRVRNNIAEDGRAILYALFLFAISKIYTHTLCGEHGGYANT